ncbi:hypothetical protein F4861DRAFT_543484 [Xylaria intraflava]|nr:hypothetical protein F4861DRAFT_543484 [Xylaria intraflava]
MDHSDTSGYRLYTVVPPLLQVIDNLTNWYIRFNRKRLKGGSGLGIEDTTATLNTLFQALFAIVRAMAPFTPLTTDRIYGFLRPHLGDAISQFRDHRSSLTVIAEDEFPADVESLKSYIREELNAKDLNQRS